MIEARSKHRFFERFRRTQAPTVQRRQRQAGESESINSEPIIQVEHLWKSFGGNPVLEDVSLQIPQGDEVSLVGGSGCGKTVLAKHFNGLLEPDRGKVIAYDTDLSEADEEQLEEVRRRIGYVFQGNALFASAIGEDVYSNVSLPLRDNPYDFPAHNEKEIEAQVAKALESVGLGSDYFDRKPNELSGGQKKRVAVARAIVAKPDTIIYDEPTTGLDPESTGMVIDLIESLYKANQTTTIVITHEKRLMERMKRVVFLRDRKIYFDGAYADFARKEDPQIVNFLTGRGSSARRAEIARR